MTAVERVRWRGGGGEEKGGVQLAVMRYGDCLRFCINGIFFAASLLTGPESQQLNRNGYGAWME